MFPSHEISTSVRVSTVAGIFRLIILGVIFILLPHTAKAVGTLIPAPSRVDMVYDSARDTVYITSGSSVLRYKIGSDSFLSSFELGGSLSGIDLSPDGNTLVVADRQRSATEVWIHIVDLQTGQSRKATFPRAFGEGGTFTVAFGNDGAVVVSSTYEGSGWVPLRRYDPATEASSQIAYSVRQNSMLTASADGHVIGFAESNSSDGPFGRYRIADGNLLRKSGYTDGTGWSNYEMGVNRNGTQYAIPTYGGTYIFDENLSRLRIVGQYAGPQPIGVVYHPAEPIVYFAWAGSMEVRAFDPNSFAQLAAYNFEHSFSAPGNTAFQQGRLKISRDGSLLFATVTGSVGSGGALSYSIAANPAHGTLSGAAPYLTYTPDADYYGADSFTFKANDGAADSSVATVTIALAAVNDAPAPVGDSATILKNATVSIPVLTNDLDVDGDSLTVITVTQGTQGGTVSINSGGAGVTYKPRLNFTGVETFTYKISDGKGGTATTTVTVTVNKK
jgi:hypothetical protein